MVLLLLLLLLSAVVGVLGNACIGLALKVAADLMAADHLDEGVLAASVFCGFLADDAEDALGGAGGAASTVGFCLL